MTPEQQAAIPLMPPPPGVVSNFDNPDSTGPTAIITLSIFLAIATFAVGLRVYTRFFIVKRRGWDDWAAIASLCFSVAVVAITFRLIHLKAFGPHTWNVRLIDFMRPEINGQLLALQVVGNMSTFLAKASILLFARALFPIGARPKAAYAVIFGLVVNCIAYIILIVYILAMCAPKPGAVYNYWDQGAPKCTQQVKLDLAIAAAAVNAVLDLYILAVCVSALWTIQMALKRKLSVIAILSLGLVACALSLATLAVRIDKSFQYDPSRRQIIPITFSALEPLIAITTASLPAMPALWVEVSTKGASSVRRLVSKVTSTGSFTTSSRNQTEYELGNSKGSSTKSLRDTSAARSSENPTEERYKLPYTISHSQKQDR